MTLIELDLEQRSEEWFEARRGIVTASVVGSLISVGPPAAESVACPKCGAPPRCPCTSLTSKKPTPMRGLHDARLAAAAYLPPVYGVADNDTSRGLVASLVAERLTGHGDDSAFMSNDMWRGVVEEPRAVERYAETTGADVTTCGLMIRDDWGFSIGYSPDGLVGDDGLLEVKAPRAKNQILTVISGEVPAYNIAQIQCGLLVSGRKWLDFIPWYGGLPLWTKRVYPDPAWQAAIVNAARAFEVAAAEMVAAYEAATANLPTTERMELEIV